VLGGGGVCVLMLEEGVLGLWSFWVKGGGNRDFRGVL